VAEDKDFTCLLHAIGHGDKAKRTDRRRSVTPPEARARAAADPDAHA